MRKKWTTKEIEYLKEQYGNTSTAEIAGKLHRSLSSVYAKASSLNLKGRMDAWTDEEVSFLQKNYLSLGAKETARQLARSVLSVHSKVREVGGGKKSIGPRVDWDETSLEYLRENYTKLDWDELEQNLGRTKQAIVVRASMLGIRQYIDPFPFFENWTQESAYIVGFFAADGWVTKRGPKSIRIGISQKDLDILCTIKGIIGTGRITRKSDGMFEYYVHSVKTYKWLCTIFGHDVHKKVRTLQWPIIPDEYIRHFIRGAMDGDGSLMKRRDGLWAVSYTTSSETFAIAFTDNIFRLTGIKLNIGMNKFNVYHTRCVGIKAVCLAKWLYKDCSIALERKAWIAREMMKTRGRAQGYSVTDKMREVFPDIISGYRIN